MAYELAQRARATLEDLSWGEGYIRGLIWGRRATLEDVSGGEQGCPEARVSRSKGVPKHSFKGVSRGDGGMVQFQGGLLEDGGLVATQYLLISCLLTSYPPPFKTLRDIS